MGNRFVAALKGALVAASLVTSSAGAQPPSYQEPAPQAPPPAGTSTLPETPPSWGPSSAHASPYATPQAQPRATHGPRRVSGPMIAGIGLIGAGYSLSLVSGMFAVLIGEAGTRCERCTPYGRWLFLPVAGPWVSMAREAETRQARIYAGILGATQSLGVLMIGLGAIVRPSEPGLPLAFRVGPGSLEMTLRF